MNVYYFSDNMLNTFIYYLLGALQVILWSKHSHYIYREIGFMSLNDLHKVTGCGQQNLIWPPRSPSLGVHKLYNPWSVNMDFTPGISCYLAQFILIKGDDFSGGWPNQVFLENQLDVLLRPMIQVRETESIMWRFDSRENCFWLWR